MKRKEFINNGTYVTLYSETGSAKCKCYGVAQFRSRQHCLDDNREARKKKFRLPYAVLRIQIKKSI